MQNKTGILTLHDGSKYEGVSFGYEKDIAGEMAFTTGMTGYTESISDPSYTGQILIFTYPLIGNYGVQPTATWESSRIHTSGLIVSNYNSTPSHWSNVETLSSWLVKEKIPALQIIDTRELTQKICRQGAMLGSITFDDVSIPMEDPNLRNLVSEVTTPAIYQEGNGKKRILVLDCGMKMNIKNTLLLNSDVTVIVAPYDTDPFVENIDFDAILISNGPGDPKIITKTISTVKKALSKNVPTMGICLGHQILALSASGDTYKLKYGHRGQNHPCILEGTKKCFLTTQNHGFAVGKIPKSFSTWFTNANDGTNEGLIHKSLPFMSVQFHPESAPGPVDTTWIFDKFLSFV